MTNKPAQRCTLPKHKILRRAETIKHVFAAGTFIKGKWFDVVYLCGAAEAGQIAFAASRRARNAVERNRIKRKLREAFRLEQINLPKLCCAILIGNPRIFKAELAAVRMEMRRVFDTAGLITTTPAS